MHRIRGALAVFLSAFLGFIGCATDAHLKPPKPPEEYNQPPDEARFSKPIEYPKDVMDIDPFAQKQQKGKTGFSGPGMGGGGGGGGMGMGGGGGGMGAPGMGGMGGR